MADAASVGADAGSIRHEEPAASATAAQEWKCDGIMAKKVRTFIAVEVSPEIRGALTRMIGKFQAAVPDVKWVEDESLHLTLKFLGDINMTDLAEICTVLKQTVTPIAPFEIEMSGLGAFPSNERPRTLWVGVTEGQEPFERLHAEVDEALTKLRFRKEARRFSPHLTFGRVREAGADLAALSELLAAHADFMAGLMDVEELVVFSSEPGRRGPVYTPLARFELRGI